jgi:hypothetical protein
MVGELHKSTKVGDFCDNALNGRADFKFRELALCGLFLNSTL